MYPNLFKKSDVPKLYNETPKNGSDTILASNMSPGIRAANDPETTCITKFSKKFSDVEEENCSELSVKTFFEFMRTAYQVNDSFEELASVLSANSEIDWTALAKTCLDQTDIETQVKLENTEALRENKNLQTIQQKESQVTQISLEESIPISTSNVVSKHSIKVEDIKSNEKVVQESPLSQQLSVVKVKSSGAENVLEEKKEQFLSTIMKRCLSDVLHEGLLDSVLPYMIPKPTISQPIIKQKSISNLEPKKAVSCFGALDSGSTNNLPLNKEKFDKNKQKKAIENEVEIHVCDEAKNIKKDFRCPQKLLVQKMCYFADVTAGQKLEEMDISVHCDIVIFDWLMRWVKKDIIKKSEWPELEASNVVPIMVSASFLQMEPLLDNCTSFCHKNMSEILKTSTILTCLNDALLTRLANLFSNADVEALKDKKDKIQSRLFCKLISSLVDVNPDFQRGHFGSLATLFKCGKCGKYVARSVSDTVPCVSSNTSIDTKGNLHNKHTRDLSWNLNDYIVSLRSELRSWRRVYWKLWGDCHFLLCRQCGEHFPVNQLEFCNYHPETPQFFVNEQQKSTSFPLGRYPCCSQRAYRFQVLPVRDGCKFREHIPEVLTKQDEDILDIFYTYRDTISLQPPQLFFPEKITRLVARNPSLPLGKLACKEIFWWDGITLVPPRPKLGLIGKIWGGSGVRKPCLASAKQKSLKKIPRQISRTESTSTSSNSDSEEDDTASGCCGESSLDEESYNSDDSHDWVPSQSTLKTKKKTKPGVNKRREGIGSWSSNLTVRYNQDNQRDFEEKAAAQMISLLTKRTLLEYNLHSKPQIHGKQGQVWNNTIPIGGTYMRLEAEFRESLGQNHKCKTGVGTKGSTRIKTFK